MTENKKNKITRTASEKLAGSERGNLGDQYEVAEWYGSGRYSVEQNENKKKQLLANIVNQLGNRKPYFSNFEVINFRGIRKLRSRIKLDPNLNVFVGVNGSGKTTILDGMVKMASWIVNGIRTGGAGKHIEISEINNHPTSRTCEISSTLYLDDNTDFCIKLNKSKNSVENQRSELAAFRNLALMYQYVDSVATETTCLPLFAYYSVSRSQEIKNEQYDSSELTTFTKLDAYNKCFDEYRSFKDFIDWLVIHDASTGSKKNDDLILLNEHKAVYDNTLKIYELLPESLKNESELSNKLKKELDTQAREIQRLNSKVINSDPESVRIVKHAISCFLDIDNIRLDVSSESVRLMLDKNGISISASALSQGEKALFSLVSDISRRLVLLNPQKGVDALKGYGVVFVDEIELHLHPKWQQQVVFKLRDVFPGLQLILTTHSPQVVTTVPPECIKILKTDASGILSVTEPEFSLGAEAKQVLEEIFAVNSRPDEATQVKNLERYKELVQEDKWDTEEAITLWRDVEKWGRNWDPIIRQLQMDVRLRKYRRDNNK